MTRKDTRQALPENASDPRRSWKLPLVLLVLLAVGIFSLATTYDSSAAETGPVGEQAEDPSYLARIEPLNDSVASGTAALVVEDGRLTVTLFAHGLEIGAVHAQQVHGPHPGEAAAGCPHDAIDTEAADLATVDVESMGRRILELEDLPAADLDGMVELETSLRVDGTGLAGLEGALLVLTRTDADRLPVACGSIERA